MPTRVLHLVFRAFVRLSPRPADIELLGPSSSSLTDSCFSLYTSFLCNCLSSPLQKPWAFLPLRTLIRSTMPVDSINGNRHWQPLVHRPVHLPDIRSSCILLPHHSRFFSGSDGCSGYALSASWDGPTYLSALFSPAFISWLFYPVPV